MRTILPRKTEKTPIGKNISIDPILHRELKLIAVRRGQLLKNFLNETLAPIVKAERIGARK